MTDVGGTYACEVFKGRTYIGGIPTASEAKSQLEKLIEIPLLSYPDWQTAKEKVRVRRAIDVNGDPLGRGHPMARDWLLSAFRQV